ncbi:MAG: hypothetical protein H6779_05220 [Candidatus Nomurabacteria bacterium]|nr:MAG: hypothetical protein H6779_05220 [Candidatus Nomurabacteria bacterium]
MSWILLATIGQFINAIVAFLDKYIVSDEKALPRPFVYAFYSCLLTGSWLLVFFAGYIPVLTAMGIPTFENIQKPTIQVVGMSTLAAYTFFMALVSLYDALKQNEAVNVMPVVGAVSALMTFAMSYLFLGTGLSPNFMWGVLVLALGTSLVTQSMPKQSTILIVFHSGLFFALHFIAMKGLFLETSFDDGFFWSRVALVLFALSLLLVPVYYEKVKEHTKGTSPKTGFLIIFAKILAGIAAFLLLKATDLGDVTVVQALDGLKFVFILLITLFFGSLMPQTCVKVDTRPRRVFRQVLYVMVITVGYFILFL